MNPTLTAQAIQLNIAQSKSEQLRQNTVAASLDRVHNQHPLIQEAPAHVVLRSDILV